MVFSGFLEISHILISLGQVSPQKTEPIECVFIYLSIMFKEPNYMTEGAGKSIYFRTGKQANGCSLDLSPKAIC